MDRTLYAALIGAAGGLVVWLLNWFWLLYSDHKTGVRVRTMLSIELEENLTALRVFLSAAENHVTLPASPLGNVQLGDQLAIAPLPTWKHDVWDRLVASIPSALGEHKIMEVHQVHVDLEELTRLKMSSRGVSSGHVWCDNFKTQINALLQRGNPLKK